MFIIIIFIFIIFLYFNPVLSASNVFIERDLAPFFIPPKFLWVAFVKSFEFPFWNPYNYSGIPLLATLQPGIFYPPHLFYLFLPFNIVWNWVIILHFVFAGFTIYLFLRYVLASRTASFIGGAVLYVVRIYLSIHSLLPHLLAMPWFPLASYVLSQIFYILTRKNIFVIHHYFCLWNSLPELRRS